MRTKLLGLCAAIGLGLGLTPAVEAVPVSMLAMKITDSAPPGLDAFQGWVDAGGFNEGVAGATDLVNNGLDFKDDFVDTNWADVLSVRVSMFSGGVEQAYVEFDAAGTSKTDFFTQANVSDSTWSDATGTGNFFSIAGDPGIDRHWFINNNYGGCGSDVGHLVVIDGDGSQPCSWETGRLGSVAGGSPNRAFLYSTASTEVNWNGSSVGVADVFAVFVTVDRPTSVDEPAPLALLGLTLSGLVAVRRRRRAA
ncbi:MAG: hypothetical protein H6983_14160 [Ectothiorhodospiraceae bacterium]|nr:hypothetical protein [Chromatiales bacterium]MCP5155310.1 hypothetical protein [Ectothiorhodospiraceae bacterium]